MPCGGSFAVRKLELDTLVPRAEARVAERENYDEAAGERRGEAIDLSRDHKPTDEDERARMLSAPRLTRAEVAKPPKRYARGRDPGKTRSRAGIG